MKLSELKAGQGKVDIEVTVKSKAEPRVFQKFGKDLKVANAVVSDSSGEMQMSLWNDDVDKINVGDTLKITNGYVSEFNGSKQLTSGKFGKLEVVKGNGAHHSAAHTPAKPAAKADSHAHSSHKEEPSKKKKEDEDEDLDMDEEDFDDEDADEYEDKEF